MRSALIKAPVRSRPSGGGSLVQMARWELFGQLAFFTTLVLTWGAQLTAGILRLALLGASDHRCVHRAPQRRVADRAARASDARGCARGDGGGVSDETRSHSGIRIDGDALCRYPLRVSKKPGAVQHGYVGGGRRQRT